MSSTESEGSDGRSDNAPSVTAQPITSYHDLDTLEWSEKDVSAWVRDLPFNQSCGYAEKFEAAFVHGPLLLKLDTELLDDIGVKKKIHQARIMHEISVLETQHDKMSYGSMIRHDSRHRRRRRRNHSVGQSSSSSECSVEHRRHRRSSKRSKENPQQMAPIDKETWDFFHERLTKFRYLQKMFEMRPWWIQFCDDFKQLSPSKKFYPVRIRGVRIRKTAHSSSSINDTYRCFGLYRGRPAYISDHQASKERRLMLWFNDRRWQVSFFTPQAIIENRRAADVQDQAQSAHEISSTAVWRVYHKREKTFHEDRNVQICLLPQALVNVIYNAACGPCTRSICVIISSYLTEE